LGVSARAAGTIAALLPLASPARLLAAKEKSETVWDVHPSEGLDAIAFLGALSGDPVYLSEYPKEAEAFGPRLPKAIRDDLGKLPGEAKKGDFGLLWPNLANLMSGADLSTIDRVVDALDNPETLVRPPYEKSPYWDDASWKWFIAAAPRLKAIFSAMRDAQFSQFRADLIKASSFDLQVSEMARGVAGYDVVRQLRKLTAREYDPKIEIITLYFVKPHGVKVQGQKFLTSPEYGVSAQVRVAAHEMLHPPLPKGGEVEKAALAVLGKDKLFAIIVADHKSPGYNTLEGYLNEDLCQAIDQLVIEQLSLAKNPADRWRDADEGMHVLAAGLYGLLRQDHWQVNGGSIEKWIASAVREGRLAPSVLHPMAARVLERPLDRLWPI